MRNCGVGASSRHEQLAFMRLVHGNAAIRTASWKTRYFMNTEDVIKVVVKQVWLDAVKRNLEVSLMPSWRAREQMLAAEPSRWESHRVKLSLGHPKKERLKSRK